MTSEKNKDHQRLICISLRKTLSKKQQHEASVRLAIQARELRPLFTSNRILAYSPIMGEVDPRMLLSNLKSDIYLPRIMNLKNGLMQFFKSATNTTNQHGCLNTNVFGIKEPAISKPRLAAKHFDVVLMPLVAFDRQGNRLGMGAGFYDRSFSFKNQTDQIKRPLLIGLAHHCQEVKSIISDSWDVSLDAIITDQELILLK